MNFSYVLELLEIQKGKITEVLNQLYLARDLFMAEPQKSFEARSLEWYNNTIRMYDSQLSAINETMVLLRSQSQHPERKKMDDIGSLLAPRPTIVCLCGSTRFVVAFFEAGWDETMKGNIVLTIGVAKHIMTPDGGHVGETIGPEARKMLDELHLRKIDLSDEILVINVDGYVGDSTKNEIRYALKQRKKIRWLETDSAEKILAEINKD